MNGLIIALTACLSSAFDAGTTLAASRQARELNPVLTLHNGRVSAARLIVLDAGGCAGTIYLRKRKHANWLLLPAAAKIALGVRNVKELEQQ